MGPRPTTRRSPFRRPLHRRRPHCQFRRRLRCSSRYQERGCVRCPEWAWNRRPSWRAVRLGLVEGPAPELRRQQGGKPGFAAHHERSGGRGPNPSANRGRDGSGQHLYELSKKLRRRRKKRTTDKRLCNGLAAEPPLPGSEHGFSHLSPRGRRWGFEAFRTAVRGHRRDPRLRRHGVHNESWGQPHRTDELHVRSGAHGLRRDRSTSSRRTTRTRRDNRAARWPVTRCAGGSRTRPRTW